MSCENYAWDLEERVEDAFVALLTAGVGRPCMIVAAYTVKVVKFPLVVVQAQASDNESEQATFNGKRKFNIVVAITTEAVNRDPNAQQPALMETAREQHRAFKSEVIGRLASTKLHDELNALMPQGIIFSLAHMTGQAKDAGDGKIVTEQTVEVIANPIEF